MRVDALGMGTTSAIDSIISGASTSNAISISVAKKAMDTAKQQGDAAVQLIQAAAATSRTGGTNQAPRTQSGSGIDRYA